MDRLLQDLSDASAGLFYISENEYPFEAVYIDHTHIQELNKQVFYEYFGEAHDAPVQIEKLSSFFSRMVKIRAGASAGEKEEALRFRHLQELLEANLQDVKVYKIGEIEISAYIIGRSALGNYIGLKTTVIET
jgi:hypothetical protein